MVSKRQVTARFPRCIPQAAGLLAACGAMAIAQDGTGPFAEPLPILASSQSAVVSTQAAPEPPARAYPTPALDTTPEQASEDVPVLSTSDTPGAFEPQPYTLANSRTTDLATFVADRSFAAFDRTGSPLSLGLSQFGPRPSAAPSSGKPGPLDLQGSLSVGVNAENSSDQSRNGQEWQIGAQLTGTITAVIGHPLTGHYLDLAYAGSLQVGGDEQSDGTLNQALTLAGHYDFSKLKLLLTADYSHSTGPDRDIGSAVDRDLVAAAFHADYPLSMKTSLNLNVNGSSNSYSAGIDSDELQAALYVNRRVSLKTTLGLGATGGAVSVESGDDQTFEQVNLSISYIPSLKLTLSAMAGYEWRQVGGTLSATPIFNGSIAYAAGPNTSLVLSAARSVSNSASQAQTNYASNTIQASVSQKIGLHMSASLALGYQSASYESVGGGEGEGGDREDDFFFARPSLNVRISPAFGFSVSYSYGENQSNERSFQTQTVNLSGTITF